MKSFFFFLASSCTLASKHPLWHYHLSSALFRPNKGGREGPLSDSLARVFTRDRDDHKEAADPSCAPSGIYSPCHFVITPSHAAIPLPNPPTPALIHMQKASFCNSSFCVLRFDQALRFPLTLQQALGAASEDTKTGRGTEKRPIKINTVALHSFTVKQQLRKTGDKYYLWNRGKRSAARGPKPPKGLQICRMSEKNTDVRRKCLEAVLDNSASTVLCGQRASFLSLFTISTHRLK